MVPNRQVGSKPVCLSTFVATLKVARCLRHDQLGFLAPKVLYSADKCLSFLPLQNYDLLSAPLDEDFVVLAHMTGEDFVLRITCGE